MALSNDELIDIGIQYLEKKFKCVHYSDSNNVVVTKVSATGKCTGLSTICFHVLRGGDHTDIKLVVAKIQNQKSSKYNLTTPEISSYFDYLANRSPYKDAFLVKEGEFYGNNRYMVADANCPGNIMVGGLIAGRMSYTNQPQVKLFLEMAKSGIEETLAFFLASSSDLASGSNKEDLLYTFFHANGCGHAHMVPKHFTFRDLGAFIEGVPSFQTKPFTEDSKYYGLHVTFLEKAKRGSTYDDYGQSSTDAARYWENQKSKKTLVHEWFESKYFYGQEVVTTNNPFSGVSTKLNQASVKADPIKNICSKIKKLEPQILKLCKDKLKESKA